MKIINISASCLLISLAALSTAFSQSVQFRIETDELRDATGAMLNPASTTPVFVYGGAFIGDVSDPADLTQAVADIRSDAETDPGLAASGLQSLLSETNFSQWGEVPLSDKEGAFVNFDWVGTLGGPANSPIYMVMITDAIDSIVSTTQVGIVSANGVVPSDGSTNVGFSDGLLIWDEAVMGSFGSFQLEAIPEPRTMGIMAGVLALLVVVRYRRPAEKLSRPDIG